jgi:hypothetical protein
MLPGRCTKERHLPDPAAFSLTIIVNSLASGKHTAAKSASCVPCVVTRTDDDATLVALMSATGSLHMQQLEPQERVKSSKGLRTDEPDKLQESLYMRVAGRTILEQHT